MIHFLHNAQQNYLAHMIFFKLFICFPCFTYTVIMVRRNRIMICMYMYTFGLFYSSLRFNEYRFPSI